MGSEMCIRDRVGSVPESLVVAEVAASFVVSIPENNLSWVGTEAQDVSPKANSEKRRVEEVRRIMSSYSLGECVALIPSFTQLLNIIEQFLQPSRRVIWLAIFNL